MCTPRIRDEKRADRGLLSNEGYLIEENIMQRTLFFIVIGLIAFQTAGCGVSKDEYMKLESEKNQLQQNVSKLSKEIDQLTREKEELWSANQNLQSESRRLQEDQKSTEAGTSSESKSEDDSLLK